jgi:hypothetical protein
MRKHLLFLCLYTAYIVAIEKYISQRFGKRKFRYTFAAENIKVKKIKGFRKK